jgi:hypothetical protein
MAAADRARAAEGPQTLGAIARMQRAHFVEAQSFIAAAPTADVPNWVALGFDGGAPISRFFDFGVSANATLGNEAAFLAAARAKNFSPTGNVMWIRGTGSSTAHDERGVNTGGATLAGLIPSWNSTADGSTPAAGTQVRAPAAAPALPTFPALPN